MSEKHAPAIANRWEAGNEITSLINDVDKLREFATNDILDLLDEIEQQQKQISYLQHMVTVHKEAARDNYLDVTSIARRVGIYSDEVDNFAGRTMDAVSLLTEKHGAKHALLAKIRTTLSFADEGWESLIDEIDEVM